VEGGEEATCVGKHGTAELGVKQRYKTSKPKLLTIFLLFACQKWNGSGVATPSACAEWGSDFRGREFGP